MKIKIILGLIIIILGLKIFGSESKEQKFWDWFMKNEKRIYNFEKDRKKIFDELSSEMWKIDKNLTFEFGPIENGKREFIISAGGILKSFPSVEKLYKYAPKTNNWEIIKFRPRRNPIYELNFGEKTIKPENVSYLLFKDDDVNKIGVILFFDNYNENEKNNFGQIGYLFLDEVVGEYDVETKIGRIVFESKKSKYFKDSKPLKEMRKEFDDYFKK